MHRHFVVVLLALLLGLQAVTTDLYLPTLPAIRDSLGTSMGEIQLTLTALLLAFGISQLVWGPMSDRFGRRPVLLWGMSAYVLASLACVAAPGIDWLIAARAVQGIAMGAAVMAARAIVRDLYPPHEGAQVMSQALTGLGVIACTCAPVGGLLSDWVGWRYALFSVTLFGLLTLGLLLWGYRETLPQRRMDALQWRSLWQSNVEIFRHPVFLTWCALSSASYLGLFTFLATSSFVFTQQLGYSKTTYGLLMLTMSLSYIVGTFWGRWMLRRTSIHRTVGLAAVLSVLGGALLTLLAHLGVGQAWYGGWAVMLPVYCYMFAHGVHQPCGQSAAVAPFPFKAGTASALNGFLMMLGAFFMGDWLGRNMDVPVFALAHGMLVWSTLLAIVAWTAVQRHGRPLTLEAA
ncbi:MULTISPECIES: multidrug effflux MFS transporter [unclassified Limnohabitans]|uniref:multidrug effflux MFS transporter n=1 Tax=unclassified Limnohabitans TaxID=2626134 RepID=UPI000D3AA068|nr:MULTISPECIES: multidrug effflux MFS transporter [unclassified Limnohabitans]PUE19215.1 Bcr/CflA family drug resistance efflux transporter [Limnohabitans sp. MMS-10A-192]PUE26040.1 Bcr/CflA family drug resistance efflux transporter [Limnohabitans sp. MMS-10A-160]